jgi:hypothetical protein
VRSAVSKGSSAKLSIASAITISMLATRSSVRRPTRRAARDASAPQIRKTAKPSGIITGPATSCRRR